MRSEFVRGVCNGGLVGGAAAFTLPSIIVIVAPKVAVLTERALAGGMVLAGGAIVVEALVLKALAGGVEGRVEGRVGRSVGILVSAAFVSPLQA